MNLSVQCPNLECAKISVVPAEAAGKRLRCKSCGQSFTATISDDGAKPANRSASRADPDEEAPRTIGRFQVRGMLGAGAFGTVYRAYDPQLDREVALKVPNPGTFNSPKRVERFLREAKAAAGLRHPHIVPIFDAGKDGNRYFIASAFIAGKKLSDAIGDTHINLRRAARLARELAEALAYAHGQGVVHRDVKPDNIMLDADDRVHLMDFGLASRQDLDSKLTSDRAVMGTPSYMAPEQARGQQGEAQPSADQYSAGIVLYELLCGTVPFEGPPAVVIHNQIHTAPDRPTRFRKDIPHDLEIICLKAIAKDPADRYGDCQDLADDLRRWMEGEPISARRLSTAERLVRWVKANRVVAGLAALAALFLLAGIAVASVLAVQARNAARVAQDNEQRAEHEAAKATEERNNALEASRLARRREYIATMISAQSAWDAVNIGRLQRLLPTQKPSAWEDDLRGLEWYYWDRMLRAGHQSFKGHSWVVTGAVFSPDGSRIYSASSDMTVRAWNVATGREDFTLNQVASVHALSISPDGRRIAGATSGGRGSTIKIWDTTTRAELHVLEEPGRVTHLAFSPDGARLLALSTEPSVTVWNVSSGARTLSLPVQSIPANTACFTVDGTQIVTANRDNTVRFWDAASGKPIRTVEGRSGVTHLSFNKDGRQVASNRGPDVVVWDATTGDDLFVLRGHAQQVTCLSFSPDGKQIVSGAYDGDVMVWDAEAKQSRFIIRRHASVVISVGFSRDGKRLVSAGWDGTVKVWDANTGQDPMALRGHAGEVKSLAFSPDGTRLVSGSRDQGVKVWDIVAGREIHSLAGHAGAIRSVRYSPDGRRIASAGEDHSVRVWDAESGRELFTYREQQHVNNVFFTPDSRRVISGDSDKTIKVWDAETGQRQLTISDPDGVNAIAVSPDATRILSWNSRTAPKIWDASSGRELLRLEGNSRAVAACFSPDGKRIATGVLSIATGGAGRVTGPIKVWDAATGKELLTLIGHTASPTSITFSPDGRRVISASSDKTARIWDADTGFELLLLRGHAYSVDSAAINPKGTMIASGSGYSPTGGEYPILLWDATPMPD